MDKFQKWVKELKKTFPPLLPVRVYRRDLSKSKVLGESHLSYSERGAPERFTILIHKTSEAVMLHILVHEWAHIYSWQQDKYVKNHGVEWGIAMSKIYQFVLEE